MRLLSTEVLEWLMQVTSSDYQWENIQTTARLGIRFSTIMERNGHLLIRIMIHGEIPLVLLNALGPIGSNLATKATP